MKMAQKSLATQKVAAYMRLAQESEEFWQLIIIFLGALFLLGAIPFYPVYIIPILALICGIVGYRVPWAGTLLGMLFALPAVAYQSPVFGWVFLMIIAVVLFEMFKNWEVISFLQILTMAPFAFGHLPFFGWVTILGMIIAAFHFGSKKSIAISIPSVMIILYLSSIWLVGNSAFMPVALSLYEPGYAPIMFSKAAVPITTLPSALGSSLMSFFSPEALSQIFTVFGYTFSNSIKILFQDSGILQLGIWGVALYLVSFLSGKIKGKWRQTLSSFAVFIVLPVYYFIGLIWGVGFKVEFAAALAVSVLFVGILEAAGVTITREKQMRRAEKTKSFGKFGLSDLSSGATEQSLDDVGGYEDVKQELTDSILMPLEKKELAYTYGLKPPSGILLFGPPGTGKTMLMRALATQLQYGFYYIKSSDILSQWYGESEKNVSEIFSIARKNAPCILFFDEIDSLGKKRTGYSADDVGPRVLSTMLAEMDGLKTGKTVIVIGATNIPNQLDSALLRPGRFDKIIYMHLPDKEARMAIFKVHTRKVPIADDVDFEKLATKTRRFSGADIKNVVTEALNIAAREARKQKKIIPISMKYFNTVLSALKPSTSLAKIEVYEQFKLDFERRVGAKVEEKPKEDVIKWGDVAGLDEVKQAILEAVELPLLHEDAMKEFKVKPSKGILLFGPPGTGKTLIVKAASNELNASFQMIGAAELMKEGYTRAVGVLKETFNRARENTPAIIFVDEIETFAPARGAVTGVADIVGQFLTEMDGVRSMKGVVVMAATNKPMSLDPAILRPGRFDKIFYIPPPGVKGREAIFKIHLGKFSVGVNLHELAEITDSYTGADIASICQEAKMEALRAKLSGKEMKITTESILRIIKIRKPSVSTALLNEYDKFLKTFGERK